MLLNNQWITEKKNQRRNLKHLETNENENANTKSKGHRKAVLREKFIAIQAYHRE